MKLEFLNRHLKMIGKKRIGPPRKYGPLLAALVDDELYTPAMIAKLCSDPVSEKVSFRRIKAALQSLARRQRFPLEGDGMVEEDDHRLVRAWLGRTWKTDLEAKDILPNPRQDPGTLSRIRGKRMKYGAVILSLSKFKLYAPETIAEIANRDTGAFENSHDKKIQNALVKFRDAKLPDQPDGLLVLPGVRALKAWFGWRWQVALPDYVLGLSTKAYIKELVEQSESTTPSNQRLMVQIGDALHQLVLPQREQVHPALSGDPICIEKDGFPLLRIILPASDAPILLAYHTASQGQGTRYAYLESYQVLELGNRNRNARRKALCDIAQGLEELHRRGEVYGWLSPDALVTVGGDCKLHRLAFGTHPDYLAPELESGAPFTPAADVFALGRLIQTFEPECPVWRRCLSTNPRRRPDMALVTKHLASKSRAGRKAFRLKRRLLAAVLFGSIVAAGLATQWSPVRNGYWILNHQGPKAAYQFFQEMVKLKDSDESLLYRYAWTAYRDLNYVESERICHHLLKTSSSAKVRANAFYLLGYIQLDSQRLEEAEETLLKAMVHYQEQDNSKNIFRTLLGLMKTAELKGNTEQAQIYLEQAEWYKPENVSAEPLLRAKSWIAFKNGDYQGALAFSLNALELIDQVPAKLGEALSGVGFYLMLVGHFEPGLAKTQEAELYIIEAFNREHYYFNLLNKILYAKCMAGEVEPMVSAANAFAQRQGSGIFKEYLEFVLSLDCGSLTVIDPGSNSGGGENSPHELIQPHVPQRVDPLAPDPPDDNIPPSGTGSGGGGGNH